MSATTVINPTEQQALMTQYERDLVAGRAYPMGVPGALAVSGPMAVMLPDGFRIKDTDPNGLNQHAPGAKLDSGKAEYDMVLFSFPNALAHVDRVGKFGAKKYTPGGFLEVPNGQARYFNAEMRHGSAHLQGEQRDMESKELHLAHKAWCALAQLELFLQGKGKPTE